MSRICVSVRTGASIYAFADDHCPPHVHARHRGEGWVARVEFSFVTNAVQLISIAPLRNVPLARVIGQLLEDVEDALPACRNAWWAMQGTVCLANRWALQASPSVTLLAERRPEAVQVGDASYDPVNGCLHIVLQNGTALAIEAGSGVEL